MAKRKTRPIVRLHFKNEDDLKLVEFLADKSGRTLDEYVAYCVMKVSSQIISKERQHANQIATNAITTPRSGAST